MRSCALLVTILLAGQARAGELTVGVLAIEAHGMSATEEEALADALTAATSDLLPGRVLGPAEVRELLKEAGTKPAQKCKAKRCWVRVGKAAELDAVLAIRAIGNKRGVALSFKWVDVGKKRIIARHQQPIRKSALTYAEDANKALKRLTAKLKGKIPESVPAPAVAAAPAPASASEPAPPAPDPVATAAEPEPPAPKPASVGESAVPVSATVVMAEAPEKSKPKPAPRRSAPAAARSSAAQVWLGLTLGRGSPGAVVQRVAEGGPGAAARLQPGDVIREWDGWVVGTAKDILGHALRTGPGRRARIKVLRAGAEKSLSITPEELGDGAEQDVFEAAAVGGPPPSSMPARPADSAPPNWRPPPKKR